MDVIRARGACAVGAPLVVWGEDYEAFEQRGRLVLQSEERLLDLPLPALMGRHQIVNAGTAVAAALQLPRASASAGRRAIERGLVDVRWPARMQRLDNGPLSRCWRRARSCGSTAATTPPAAAALAQTLAELEERAPKPRRPHRRHDGQEGCRRLPRALPRPRAPRRHRAHPRRARGPASRPRRLPRRRARSGSRPSARTDVESALKRCAPSRIDSGAEAHPDLRLALSCRPRPGAAGGRRAAGELRRSATAGEGCIAIPQNKTAPQLKPGPLRSTT